MFYRVSADLLFVNEDEARDFYHDCENACPKSIIINPGQPNEEQGTITLQQCFHDQNPATPCNILIANTCPPP